MNPLTLWPTLNPRARAMVLFAGLGILNTLVQALVLPSVWEYGDSVTSQALPIMQPSPLLMRLGFAALSFAVVVWAVRPGQRSKLETVFLGVYMLAYSVLVSMAYQPALMLTVVPVVVRYWWSLRRTLVFSLSLAALLMLLIMTIPPGWSIKTTDDLAVIIQTIVLQLVQGGFAYAAFELTLRREEDRTALRQALGELRQYHGLELQHAALEERTRISRELHDTLGHELTALRLELQMARRLTGKPDELRESLGRALTRSGESMSSLQSAVKALRPPVMDGTLMQAIGDLLRAWPAAVTLNQSGEESRLSPAARLAAFRCVQESLTNALKHTPGQQVSVNVQWDETFLNLSILNPLAAPGMPFELGGSGLRGLQDRVEEVGGTLRATCREQEFELLATLPLEDN